MKLRPDRAKLSERTEKRSMFAMLMFGLLFIGFVGESPLEFDKVMYHGTWRSVFVEFAPLVTSLPGISMTPWQILLIARDEFLCRLKDQIHKLSGAELSRLPQLRQRVV